MTRGFRLTVVGALVLGLWLTAGAQQRGTNGTGHHQVRDETILGYAKTALELTDPGAPIEQLVDAFFSVKNHQQPQLRVNRQDAVAALNVARMERAC